MTTPQFTYSYGDLAPEEACTPLKSLHAMGFRPPGNSDATGTQREALNPWHGIWCAMAHRSQGGLHVAPEEAIDMAEALRVFTRDAAVACHMDDRGVLSEGRLADLVVLDADPFTTPLDDVPEMPVAMTVIGGVPQPVGPAAERVDVALVERALRERLAVERVGVLHSTSGNAAVLLHLEQDRPVAGRPHRLRRRGGGGRLARLLRGEVLRDPAAGDRARHLRAELVAVADAAALAQRRDVEAGRQRQALQHLVDDGGVLGRGPDDVGRHGRQPRVDADVVEPARRAA